MLCDHHESHCIYTVLKLAYTWMFISSALVIPDFFHVLNHPFRYQMADGTRTEARFLSSFGISTANGIIAMCKVQSIVNVREFGNDHGFVLPASLASSRKGVGSFWRPVMYKTVTYFLMEHTLVEWNTPSTITGILF